MRKYFVILSLVGMMLLAAPSSRAAAVLVGACVEFTPCYFSTTPWSDTLSLAELTAIGLGSSVDMVGAQTSQFIIRLGVTTFKFDTATGPVTETLGEFNGLGSHPDPCAFCEIDTVG